MFALQHEEGVCLDEAFQALRQEARNSNRKLHDLVHDLVRGDAGTATRFNPA